MLELDVWKGSTSVASCSENWSMGLTACDAVPSISTFVWFFFLFVARGGIFSLPLIGTGSVAHGQRFRLLFQTVCPVPADCLVHQQIALIIKITKW